jgi:hypothetical protein
MLVFIGQYHDFSGSDCQDWLSHCQSLLIDNLDRENFFPKGFSVLDTQMQKEGKNTVLTDQ